MFKAKVIDNFLSQEECNYILDFVKSIEVWESGGTEFWENRSLNAITIYNNIDKSIGTALYGIREDIGNAIKKEYQIEEDIYPDLMQVVRWFPGQEQHPHWDDMKEIDGTEWFHHREFGSVLYLNDNYSGGKTYYPEQNFEVTPKTGSLAFHPGDKEHTHGVSKIENETRYTITTFWTKDKKYFDGWKI